MRILALLVAMAVLPGIRAGMDTNSEVMPAEKRLANRDWQTIYGQFFDDVKSKNHKGIDFRVNEHFVFIRDVIRPLCPQPPFGEGPDLTDLNCLIYETHMRLYKFRNTISSSSDWDSLEAIQLRGYMLMWLTMTPLNIDREVSADDRQTIVSILQGQIYNLIRRNGIDAIQDTLTKTKLPSLKQMRKMNAGRCTPQLSNWESDLACSWENLQSDLSVLLKARNSIDTVKRLSLDHDYNTLLEQQQLKNIVNGATLELQDSLEGFTTEIASVMDNNFDKLGNYFATLAQFDGNIAEADIKFIQGRLVMFRKKLESLNWALTYDATYLAEMGEIIAGLDMAFAWVKALADMVNGIFTAIGKGDFSGLSTGYDSVNTATDATMNLIKATAIPKLIKDVRDDAREIFNGFMANEDFLKSTVRVLELESGNEVANMTELEEKREEFFKKYNEYDPQVGSDDIARVGVKWETVVELIGNVVDDVSQAGASGGKAVIYAENYIERMKFYVPQITALLQSRYDYQFNLMDNLAAHLRSKLAMASVEELRESMKEVQTNWKDSQIARKQAALSTLIISQVHTMQVLQPRCNELEYLNAGKMPDVCNTAMSTLSDFAISQVLSFLPSISCRARGSYFSIPVTKKGRTDAINLQELYSGNKTTFRIPNAQWLVDYGWLPPTDTEEKVFYVKGFEIFLVSGLESDPTIQVGVDITPSGTAVLMKDTQDRTRYDITTNQTYELIYKENPYSCERGDKNPYKCDRNRDMLSKMCVEKDGVLENKYQVYSSIFTEWTVQVDVNSDLKRIPDFVEVDETLFLLAKVTLCDKNKAPNLAVHTPSTDEVSGENIYYDRKTQRWKSCPFGSREALGGYYCEPRPCWRKEDNKGDYPPSALIEEKKVASEEECMDMCEENAECRAAILSPAGDCHIVNTAEVTERAGWKTAITYKCPEWALNRREEPIPWNFTRNSLQIRTDDKTESLWSRSSIYVYFLNDLEESESNSGMYVRGITIKLRNNSPTYRVTSCLPDTPFDEELPDSDIRLWTVDWDAENFRMKIFCNGQKMADLTMSDWVCSADADWRRYYSEEIKFITFMNFDSESNHIRRGDKTNRT